MLNCGCNRITINTPSIESFDVSTRENPTLSVGAEEQPSFSIKGQKQARLDFGVQDCAKFNINTSERGPAGKDATINGVNTLTLEALGLIRLTQVGSVATLTSDCFIHEQGVSSSVWTINHNLNKYPSVCVVDSSGSEVIAEVEYTSLNSVIIRMTSAFKGKAYLN